MKKILLLLVSSLTLLPLGGKAGLVTEWRQQQKGTSATSADNGLTEQSISYNLDGNLTALTRRGASGTATQTLSFSYNGPMRTTWTYDNHGNVTADPQGSMSLAWNVLDMPRTLTSGSASTQRSYLADGTLAQVYDGSTTRLYVGDMVFTRSGTSGTPVLESAAWEGGRLVNGSGPGNVLYHVTDHLGSVRVVKDGAGTVRQRFDYYPYGSVSRVYTNSSTTDSSVKRYRFGGKEIAGTSLTDLAGTGAAPGAPYLDFGARLYSPGTASWLSVDPMAEKYYGIGSLTYCAANPLHFIDPFGRELRVAEEYQAKFLNDLRYVFGDNATMFVFNENGTLLLNGKSSDFIRGLSRDQRSVFNGLNKAMNDKQITSIVYADKYNITIDNESKPVDIVQEYGGGLYSQRDNLIVIAPSVSSVDVRLDQMQMTNGMLGFPTQTVQQNTTSALFHEIGERNTNDINYRGGVIDYENYARRVIGLPVRPYDLNHSKTIKTTYK